MINIPNIPQIDMDKLGVYARLVRLDKPVGIFLLLWPTMWALFITSNGIPTIKHIVVFILGVILMRSAGCAINDYADRDIDPHISRTSKRPIATGELQPSEALLVAAVLVFIAFLLVLIFLNTITLYFAIGGALLAASYPYMKRIHFLPQVHLGVAFACSVPMAFTAVSNDYPPPIAWLIFTCAVIWTTAYDTMYAIADREEDIKIGVKSTAILFGSLDKFAVGLMQLLVIICLILIGINAKLSWIFYLSVGVGVGFFIYQQVLIKHRFADRCFYAFLNNQYFGLVIFLGILGHYLLHD